MVAAAVAAAANAMEVAAIVSMEARAGNAKPAEAASTTEVDAAFQLELRAAAIAEALTNHKDTELFEALKITLEGRPAVVQALADWAIPDRAYASARLLLENRICGTVKSFNEATGYGFIESPAVREAFGNDVFLHYSQLGPFGPGDEVSFAILLSRDGKPQAFDLGPAQNGQDVRRVQGPPGSTKGSGWAPTIPPKGGKAGSGKGSCKGWGATGWGADANWAPGASGWGGGWAGNAMGGCWGGPFGAAKGGWNCNTNAWSTDWDSSGSWASSSGIVVPGAAAAAKGKGGQGWGKNPQVGKQTADDAGNGLKDKRHEGFVKSFNEKSGFGFIACEELKEVYGNDVFMHHKQFPGGCELHQAVSFSVFLSKEGKPQAYDVEPHFAGAGRGEHEVWEAPEAVGAPPAKRARME